MDMTAHLKSRGVDPSKYQMHYDEEVATFYLFNLSNQIVGYQHYRPAADKTRKNNLKEGRYYTLCKDKLGVWGLETFFYRTDLLVLTEGIFDAVKIHNQGLPAIAALANDPKHIAPWLKIIRQTRTLIGVCDNDVAGNKLRKHVDISLTLCDNKDLGDMTNKQVGELLWKELRL